MRIADLFVYPIKSVAGVAMPSLELDEFGPVLDRRWMLVDEAGVFVSQRNDPRLALARVHLTADGLQVSAADMPLLYVPFVAIGRRIMVQHITDDSSEAVLVSSEADTWFSSLLGRAVRLVCFANERTRRVDAEYVPEARFTSFNDGFPLLIASQASLDALNAKLEQAVTWARFRPNIVIAGNLEPHAEDTWQSIRLADLTLQVVKPCARCVMITNHPETGARGVEPMRTLAKYRTQGHKVLFGQNAVHLTSGVLRVGDALEILQ